MTTKSDRRAASIPSAPVKPGKVAAMFLCVKRAAPLRQIQQARALLGYGLEGDVHTKRRLDAPNQVLVIDTASLAAQGLKPGDLREQITVDFPPLHGLPAGSLLRIGNAVLQISGHCVPCTHIGDLLQMPDSAAFKKSLEKRRGMLCAIVSVDGDGLVRVSDKVELLHRETEKAVISTQLPQLCQNAGTVTVREGCTS
ncbi:MAG: hypothetical protein EXR67_01945 [Dehalococcoidia bacterium]|nr:hypothetical protein [Dehalococcoidia bacterium]